MSNQKVAAIFCSLQAGVFIELAVRSAFAWEANKGISGTVFLVLAVPFGYQAICNAARLCGREIK